MRGKIWIGVGLAVAAGSVAQAAPLSGMTDTASRIGGAANAQPVADTSMPAPRRAGQGGEGGEAGAASAASIGDPDYLAGLAEIHAHLLISQELVDAGDGKAAADRLQHAIEAIYPRLAARLAANQSSPIAADLAELARLAPANAAAFSVKNMGLTERLIGIEPAVLKVPGTEEAVAAQAIALLVKHAAVEFREAVTDGKVAQLPEYQYAYGFVRMATKLLAFVEPALTLKDNPAAEEIIDAIFKLKGMVASLSPAGPLATPAEFTALASRIELKASRFTN